MHHLDRFAPLLFAAVLLILFWRGLWIEPAGDDWLLLTPVREMVREVGVTRAILQCFTYPIIDQFYRPLALLPQFLITDVVLWAQLLKLLTQVLFFVLLRHTARALGIPSPWSSLVAAIPLLHQVFTSVLTEIDLWGDQLSALAFVALFAIALRYDNGKTKRIIYFIAATLITVGCVLAKEAGVACIATPLGFALLSRLRRDYSAVRGHLIAASGTAMVAALYLFTRYTLGIDTHGPHEGYYSLNVGMNIFLNCGLFVLALFSPVNTVEVALGSMPWKFMAAVWVIGWLSVAGLGLRRHILSRTWPMAVLLIVLALAAQGPVFFMPHLTEANLTRSLALGWLAMALLVKPVLESAPSRRAVTILLAVVIVWFVFDIQAICSKTRDIKISQGLAGRFRRELQAQVSGSHVTHLQFALENPGYQGYSVYRQPFLVDATQGELTYGLRDLYRVPDLKVDWFETPPTDRPDTLNADFYVRHDGHVFPAKMQRTRN